MISWKFCFSCMKERGWNLSFVALSDWMVCGYMLLSSSGHVYLKLVTVILIRGDLVPK